MEPNVIVNHRGDMVGVFVSALVMPLERGLPGRLERCGAMLRAVTFALVARLLGLPLETGGLIVEALVDRVGDAVVTHRVARRGLAPARPGMAGATA